MGIPQEPAAKELFGTDSGEGRAFGATDPGAAVQEDDFDPRSLGEVL